jgi:CheY-like chemotaxis protein
MEKIILVVDDSRLSRMMISAMIKEHDTQWTILEASSADEAVKQCEQHTVTAITLDMNMPGKSGLEIAPKLKEMQPSARIVLLTANVQKSVKTEAESLGLSFISKPVTEDKVVSYLKAVEESL